LERKPDREAGIAKPATNQPIVPEPRRWATFASHEDLRKGTANGAQNAPGHFDRHSKFENRVNRLLDLFKSTKMLVVLIVDSESVDID
jgi:hypothetical protein